MGFGVSFLKKVVVFFGGEEGGASWGVSHGRFRVGSFGLWRVGPTEALPFEGAFMGGWLSGTLYPFLVQGSLIKYPTPKEGCAYYEIVAGLLSCEDSSAGILKEF